MISRLAEDSK